MAAEPPANSPHPASSQVLPPYPELILTAINAIDPKNGANKSSISRQIEATYGTLPAAHWTLLSHHLNKMKSSGQLIIYKNNYLEPDPNAPPRRGRGRPPKGDKPVRELKVASSPRPRGRPRKEKVDLPEGTVSSSPRPRGRPPKPRDALSVIPTPAEGSPSISGRKRGRPRKLGKPATSDPPPQPPSGERRGRGRPPKVKTPAAASVGA